MSKPYSSVDDWGLYIPPGAPSPYPEALWPYPKIDVPDGVRPLLVVVNSAATLHAVRELKKAYPRLPVVIWAWQLAETLAAASEDFSAVLYGWPSHEDVIAAYKQHSGRTEETTVLLECESAFSFPVLFDLKDDYFHNVATQQV